MDVKALRLERLQQLLDEHGGNKAALARTLKRAPAQVSQWFNGLRNIGEDAAREIEAAARRPAGWLDTPIGSPTADSLVVADALRTLGPEARREALEFIRWKLEQAREVLVSERLAQYIAAARDEPDPSPPNAADPGR